jgi:hypothetical protein
VLQEQIPKDWPELILKLMEKHKEVAKAGVTFDLERVNDPDINRFYACLNRGPFPTDTLPDRCFNMLTSTQMAMWRWDTFEDFESVQINNHHYNPKFTVGGVMIGDRFTCIHLGWEMWKKRYRVDMDFTAAQEPRTYMTAIRHLMGISSFFNKGGTPIYKDRR